MRRLVQYGWPGNVRELQNVIEHAAILARNGRIRIDLPVQRHARAAARTAPIRQHLLTEDDRRDRDRANIVAALEACGGKVFGPGGAAELLNVRPTTLSLTNQDAGDRGRSVRQRFVAAPRDKRE